MSDQFGHELKLNWASYHLDSLEAKVREWRERHTHRYDSHFDHESGKQFVYIRFPEPVPTEFRLIVGDCLHNLRSALDNLAIDLAISYKGEPLPSNIESDSGFPIFVEENPSKLNKMLGGVNPCAKTVIEGLQPYRRGQKFRNDPLWQLNKLSNIDKHRLPHPTLFATAGFGFVVPMGVAVDEIEPIFGPVKDRAPIARHPAVDDTGAEVNMQFTPTLSIAFGQTAPKQLRGLPVPDRLSHIHRHIVRKVLSPLGEFLTPH